MDENASSRLDVVEVLFKRTLDAVHGALVSYYFLSEEEALDAERELEVWFQRLTRRNGASQMSARVLRLSLLAAACQYGRSFQVWKLAGEPSTDHRLNEILAREPQEIANDLERSLEGEPRQE